MARAQHELLASAVDSLYDCVLDASRWPDALQALAATFEVRRLSVIRFPSAPGAQPEVHQLNHDPDAQRLYQEHYWRCDPTAAALFAAPVGQWIDCTRQLDPRFTSEPEYVNDYAVRHGIGWVGGGKVHADAHGVVGFSMQRWPGERVSRSDARVFDAIAPHIARASRLAQELQLAREGRALSEAAISGLSCAAFVLAADSRVLFANTAGERLLQAGMPFGQRAGRMELARRSNEAAHFAAAVRDASGAGRGPSALRVDGAGQGDWLVRVLALPQDSALAAGGRALVYVTPAQRAPVPAIVLRELFALSASEAEVARMLADGLTLKEIALERHVSMETVRTQATHVRAKTGVRRLTELSKLLAGLLRTTDDAQPRRT